MQWSLFHLTSLATRRAIVAGRIRNLDQLPLHLRRWLYRMLQLKDLLNCRNCIECFGQPGFFDGFDSIEMLKTDRYDLRCQEDDSDQRPESSFASFLAGHFRQYPHLTKTITGLNLLVTFDDHCPNDHGGGGTVRDVCNIIRSCGSLMQISLQLVGLRQVGCRSSTVCDLLDAVESSGASGLQQLSLSHVSCSDSFPLDRCPNSLRSLRSLSLHNCKVSPSFWLMLTAGAQRLRSVTLHWTEFRRKHISTTVHLPASLEFLSIGGLTVPVDFSALLDRCPLLSEVYLLLARDSLTDAVLSFSADFLRRKSRTLALGAQIAFPSTLQLIQAVGANIFDVHFCNFTARSPIIVDCPNLTSLTVTSDNNQQLDVQLGPLFADRCRAGKLRRLMLLCPITDTTIDLLFANCCNLTSLTLATDRTEYLTDRHLIVWAENGAKPARVSLKIGPNVGRVGLIALLKAGGMRLKSIAIRSDPPQNHSSIINVLVNWCPMVEDVALTTVTGLSDQVLEQLLESTFFRVRLN